MRSLWEPPGTQPYVRYMSLRLQAEAREADEAESLMQIGACTCMTATRL